MSWNRQAGEAQEVRGRCQVPRGTGGVPWMDLHPLARGFSCSQGPSQELAVRVLDAGHTLWTREWDPGTQGALGRFRDGGKEALNTGFQRR